VVAQRVAVRCIVWLDDRVAALTYASTAWKGCVQSKRPERVAGKETNKEAPKSTKDVARTDCVPQNHEENDDNKRRQYGSYQSREKMNQENESSC
jgi:hypothetical protein